ncbi:hypothetical protein RND71_010764 [Anisodus tanguticus]|uniref:Uncharacterized protein n=1 Tax=Anisodus tanguticus TaxID=243964 RepID=A0AAE1VSE4_9SOLA|nr:hypothetical protein RND71_010764 [Anisodus tanguticus]
MVSSRKNLDVRNLLAFIKELVGPRGNVWVIGAQNAGNPSYDLFHDKQVNDTVHIGGLVRLDLVHASVETIYVTVWASPSVSLHVGITENADELKNNHAGVRLQTIYNFRPPLLWVTDEIGFILFNLKRKTIVNSTELR